jgi:hypothetical protein
MELQSSGSVWVPNRVVAGRMLNHDGHWASVDPWGWTWVDDARWGFAVSHYGRWANLSGTWGVPGLVHLHAAYAPALVAFVGDNDVQLSISVDNVESVDGLELSVLRDPAVLRWVVKKELPTAHSHIVGEVMYREHRDRAQTRERLPAADGPGPAASSAPSCERSCVRPRRLSPDDFASASQPEPRPGTRGVHRVRFAEQL